MTTAHRFNVQPVNITRRLVVAYFVLDIVLGRRPSGGQFDSW